MSVEKSRYKDDLLSLSQEQHYTDVIFLCGNVGFSAHRFLLAASSPLLMKIFTTDFSSQEQSSTRSNSEASLLSTSYGGVNATQLDFFNTDDTEVLIPGSESDSPARGYEKLNVCGSDMSPSTSSSDDQRSYKDSNSLRSRTWARSMRLSNTSSQQLARSSTEKRVLDSPAYRASSKTGWNCTAGGILSYSPSIFPRNVLPQIFTYEPKPGVFRNLTYPAFNSIRIEQIQSLDGQGRILTSVQTIITCSKLIQPQAMNQIIQYIYGDKIDPKLCSIADLKQAAEFIDVPDLYNFLTNEVSLDAFNPNGIVLDINNDREDTKEDTRPVQSRGMTEVCLLDSLFSDIVFRLDDGAASAHKPLLMARCDMMRAMFSHNDFKEKSARIIHFPGVSALTFHQLLHYIYTDDTPPKITTVNCVDLIELANRLWLPRLVTLVEAEIVKQFSLRLSVNPSHILSNKKVSDADSQRNSDSGMDLSEESLSIVQPCQMHNANQLASWCLSYLSLNYNHICRKYPKILRLMHPENQAALNVNRWPPIWYLKDHDNYQRMVMEREREERPKNIRKRARRNSGCLCFSSLSSGMSSDIGGRKSRKNSEA